MPQTNQALVRTGKRSWCWVQD